MFFSLAGQKTLKKGDTENVLFKPHNDEQLLVICNECRGNSHRSKHGDEVL